MQKKGKNTLWFDNTEMASAWASEILQENLSSCPSNVDIQNLPGNGNGLELSAAF